jgi:hypothetical protein
MSFENRIIQIPRKGNYYRALGEYYNNTGAADKALSEFSSISKEHPDDLQTREDYIRLLLSNNRTNEGEKISRRLK